MRAPAGATLAAERLHVDQTGEDVTRRYGVPTRRVGLWLFAQCAVADQYAHRQRTCQPRDQAQPQDRFWSHRCTLALLRSFAGPRTPTGPNVIGENRQFSSFRCLQIDRHCPRRPHRPGPTALLQLLEPGAGPAERGGAARAAATLAAGRRPVWVWPERRRPDPAVRASRRVLAPVPRGSCKEARQPLLAVFAAAPTNGPEAEKAGAEDHQRGRLGHRGKPGLEMVDGVSGMPGPPRSACSISARISSRRFHRLRVSDMSFAQPNNTRICALRFLIDSDFMVP